ncbi:hypothetical protein DFR50_1568 [Roseiarcus fermentans]|uniref:Cell division and transport-associated protein TolA n=2 Tax=Roseiarcus fermentans TaxID=1473586 RepID=A0A366EHT5_9HYPH|nr:hypothetical protein DFR50_1568 [Roseiarcus fermentans]
MFAEQPAKTTRWTPALPIALSALIALSAAACDRIWPTGAETQARDTAKPASTLAAVPVPSARPAHDAAAPPAPPQRMTGAQEAEFEAWIVRTYLGCWRAPAQPADSDPYVARVRLAFKPDGSLARAPKLVNPPSDPALKPQAKSVMQAVQACNPLSVPAQYRPFYEQWRTQTIQFNPQIASR